MVSYYDIDKIRNKFSWKGDAEIYDLHSNI